LSARSRDAGKGLDSVAVAKSIEDYGKVKSEWVIYKYPKMESEAQRLLHYLHHILGWDVEKIQELGIFERPSVLWVPGNVLLNEGIDVLWHLAAGTAAPAPFNAANAYIGVGDGTAPESATQTGLQGTSKAYKAMDAGYPTRPAANQCRWQSTFTGTEANFSWYEITVANGPSDAAANLNRKVQDLGTKAAGTTWVAQLTITIS